MEFPFFFMKSSLHLLGLQLMELQFARVKNISTKPRDVSLPPFHTGATMVESSAYLESAGSPEWNLAQYQGHSRTR